MSKWDARMYPLADLPNTAGFAFVGILKDGTRVNCHVIKDPSTGLHSVAGASFADLRGWVKLPAVIVKDVRAELGKFGLP